MNMFKNFLTTAIRTLFRNKLYSLLNIAGLTFGISCFLLIGLYLFDELTYDTQHSKSAKIYRVIEHKTVNGEKTTIAGAGFKLAEEAKSHVDPRLLASYEKIRKNYRNGLAVVPVERDACGGCFYYIPPQKQSEIKQRKKVMVCENCGRILVDSELTESVEVK